MAGTNDPPRPHLERDGTAPAARVLVAQDACLTPGVIVAAHWQTMAARSWVRYSVETDAWEWQQVSERVLQPTPQKAAA